MAMHNNKVLECPPCGFMVKGDKTDVMSAGMMHIMRVHPEEGKMSVKDVEGMMKDA